MRNSKHGFVRLFINFSPGFRRELTEDVYAKEWRRLKKTVEELFENQITFFTGGPREYYCEFIADKKITKEEVMRIAIENKEKFAIIEPVKGFRVDDGRAPEDVIRHWFD